jgi:hypothetical protein
LSLERIAARRLCGLIPVNLPEEGELRLLDGAEPTSCLAKAQNRITCAARMVSESLLTLLKRVNRIFTEFSFYAIDL